MRSQKQVVVVGHGMVAHRFVEALGSRDAEGIWWVTVLAEESVTTYDRVGLTDYTEHWDRARLALPGNDYAADARPTITCIAPSTTWTRSAPTREARLTTRPGS